MTQTFRSKWERLIYLEAQDIADRENEASSHCGPYGRETAEDYIDEVREYFEQIGKTYLDYVSNPDGESLGV